MILVVGADSLIGGGVYRILKSSGREVLGTSRRPGSEHLHLDLGAPEGVCMPPGVDVAVICAGVGDVAACARSPKKTFRINVSGTAEVARRAAESGSRVIILSSSLVFDGQAGSPNAETVLSPCCEYGRQKAALEAHLAGENCAVVRLTKVVESLRPRFSSWLVEMNQGRPVMASTKLRCSPVSLDEAVQALCGLVADFRSGIFHISGDENFTYYRAAVALAKEKGFSTSLVLPDETSGLEFFHPVPLTSSLAPSVPANCSGWRFSPSSVILDDFLRSL